MSDETLLLTVVLESSGPVDRESLLYRRLLRARLKWEHVFHIEVVSSLTTERVKQLSCESQSRYIVFINSRHEISPTYLPDLLEHLNTRTIYLAEPTLYTGKLPKKVNPAEIDPFTRHTEIYGVAFRTNLLQDMLEAFSDVDVSSIYIAYRLYWSVGTVKPLEVGYSTSSDKTAIVGMHLSSDAERLLPLIPTPSSALRTHILRMLTLYLRGLRDVRATSIPLAHLSELVKTFQLVELIDLAASRHPFEAAWIQWIDDPSSPTQLFKRLTCKDAHLSFQLDGGPAGDAIPLYDVTFPDVTMHIGKTYIAPGATPANSCPATVDFYRHPITETSVMLFFDRPMQADDNAEHLYAYLRATRPEYQNAYFALNPKSTDWARLEAKGFNLVRIFSPEFRELFLRSDLVASSQIYNLSYRGKTLANSRFVYLQHGIQLNDMTDWVLSKHFDVFVATGKLEADYLAALAPVETINSGLPRLESLRRKATSERIMMFMPTWRMDLHQLSDGAFTRSEYFRAIDRLLTDRVLLGHLAEHEITLHVKLHPNIEKRAHLFHFSQNVVHSTMSYREAFEQAAFIFTDYSSAVLDAAFIQTPIAYYQWDSERFFQSQPYRSRLDYSDTGMGPVLHEHEEIVDYLTAEKYAVPNELYTQRRNRFFEGVDPRRINEPIIERMLAL